jgi:hypothetical protein
LLMLSPIYVIGERCLWLCSRNNIVQKEFQPCRWNNQNIRINEALIESVLDASWYFIDRRTPVPSKIIFSSRYSNSGILALRFSDSRRRRYDLR